MQSNSFDGKYEIWRDESGIANISAQSKEAMFYAQGLAHAKDRGMQILLMRLIGQGRLAEHLDSSDNSIKIDTFFRRMNWFGNIVEEVEKLSEKSLQKINSYCAGINHVLERSRPLDLTLLGYKHEPWTIEDSILISRMVGYLTLAQSQGEIERLVIEMIQAGIRDDKLEALFPNLLNELDRELINKVTLEERIVPNEILWQCGAPRMMASNNWVVSGSKTKSGKPILSNDPHLEVNRLPNVWYEISLSSKDDWYIGSSMPGLPGVLLGRSQHLAWGATYAFVDTIDSWIENCKKGQYYREENQQWFDFKQRKEIIKVKGKPNVEVVFYENELGTLEGDPFSQEYCLITKWAAAESGCQSLEAAFGLLEQKTVKQGMKTYGLIETGWNYVFADQQGDIGYQMSGKVPLRRKGLSGLIPYPAW